ncbi:MAG: hypothetical protein JSV03_01890 [Planctomycetota bacterium]|nr:MAG: hypothetical protein JSV03_01890 [Planctomycetota bacterium]
MGLEDFYGIPGNDKGGALLIVLAIMLMLIIAALMAVDTAQTDIDLSFNQLHYDQAFYVADAGLKQAHYQLMQYNQWETGFVNVVFDEGEYSVAVIHSDVDSLIIDTVTLRATGVVDGAVANLEAIVVPELWFPFQFAVFGDDSLIMTNSCCTDSYNSDSGSFAGTVDSVEGDIASNGLVELTNTALVGGDASTSDTGGLSLCATCVVEEDTASGVEPYTLDPIPDSQFTYAHDFNSAPGGMSGSFTYDPVTHDLTMGTMDVVQLDGGVYYFNDINFEANSQLHVTPGHKVMIYMTGNLLLQSNTSVNPNGLPSDLMIFSSGSFTTMGTSIDVTASFYGPDADVFIGNSCDFFGSVIADAVIIDNSVCAHYDRALSAYAAGVTGKMILLAWKEL